MTLQDLYKKLEKQTAFRLADLFPAAKNIGTFFPALTPAAPLVLEGIAVKSDGAGDDMVSVTVSGQTKSFSAFGAVGITVVFTEEADEIAASLDVHLGGAITFPGVSWFGMRNVDLKAGMSGGEPPITGELSGELTAAPGFRFMLQMPTKQNQWLIQGTFEDPSVPSIANFFQLIGGINLFTLLPPPFDTFSDLGLRQMDIEYDATGKKVVQISMIIQTSQTWTLLPKLTVENIELTCVIDNPGDRQKREVSFDITGDFSIGDPSANTLQVNASAPPFQASAALVDGEIQLGDALTFFMHDSIDLGAALTDFDLSLKPSEKTYDLTAGISADRWELDFGLTTLAVTELGLHITNSSGQVSGGVKGTMHIGPDDGGVDLRASAEHPDPDGGWVLSAGLEGAVPLVDLAAQFLQEIGGAGSVPDWVTAAQLDIRDVSFTAELPPKKRPEEGKTFTVQGAVDWAFNYGSINTALSAEVMIAYKKAPGAAQSTSGYIKGAAELFGLLVTLGYEFSPTDKSLFIEWEGIRGTYTKQVSGQETITLVLGDMSMGRVLSLLMRTFDPDFQLEAPWNVLNDINFNGLSLVYNLTTKAIKVTYTHKIDLVFVTFTSLTLTKNTKGVLLSAEGSFLGQAIGSTDDTSGLKDGRDVTDMPPVPGAGSQLFELHYLGLGQHVSLYPPPKAQPNVGAATKALQNVFSTPPSPKPGKPPILPIPVKPAEPPAQSMLIFNRDSNWLIGMRATVLQAITLSAIFNDPDLYGLLIEVGGNRFPKFKNLKFEILYKKVTDSIGVYHIELTLPDAMRQLEFGVVSVTLPVIGVDIYTNGNFKLDFGFPYNMDFSRSMTVQMLPFTGSGGFYFAYLNSATSSRVPVTTMGRFDPVIEFGLGLQLGIGKDVSKGIFKAGLSLTIIGIVEGVLGFYIPNQPSYPGKDEIYYWIQGTVGLVGHVYGEVNFSIISARLDVRIYAYVQVTIEKYNAIPILLEAGVSVSLRVKIKLGLFSIKISLKFSTTIRASFVIGEDRRAWAPWNDIPAGAMAFALPASAARPLLLTWQPLNVPDDQKEDLALYFLPHLTLSGEGGAQAAQYVAMLYTDSPEPGSPPGADTSLHKLTRAALAWVINACDNGAKTVSLDTLRTLHRQFSNPTQTGSPIAYDAIVAFLRGRFKPLRIIDPDTARKAGLTDLHATVFPMIPDLQLETAFSEADGVSVSFKSPENVTPGYQQQVRATFQDMAVDYRSEAERASDQAEFTSNNTSPARAGAVSMATAVFEDFFTLIARAALQDAIDSFENYQHTVSGTDSLDSIARQYTTDSQKPLTRAAVAEANRAASLNAGLTLHIPGIGYQVRSGDTFEKIALLFNAGLAASHQIAAADFDTPDGFNAAVPELIKAGTVIQVGGFSAYTTTANDTLTSIAASLVPANGSGPATVAQVIEAVKDQPVLRTLALIHIPVLAYTTASGDTFESIATLYGVTPARIAGYASNGTVQSLFAGPSILIPDLEALPIDTLVGAAVTAENVARISGMAARYLLHGLRLPDPDDMQTIAPLYVLTRQQVAVPALKKDDRFSFTLKNGSALDWITFNGAAPDAQKPATLALSITLDNGEISRVNALASLQLDPVINPNPPQPMALGHTVNRTFALKSAIEWQYPGEIALPVGQRGPEVVVTPTIWQLSPALLHTLQHPPPETDLALRLRVATQPRPNDPIQHADVGNYAWATLVQVTLRKIPPNPDAPVLANTYEVIGADETGIVYVERLLRHLKTYGEGVIEQIQLLYRPSQTGDAAQGLQSEANGAYKMALVKGNLSTETNPVEEEPVAFAFEAPESNTLNAFTDFVELLWQCSIVRSGGFYLYYNVTDGAKSLPDHLFRRDDTGTISILITYKGRVSEAFLNSAVIAQPINPATSSLYAESDALTTLAATVPPGHVGIEVERARPAEYAPVEQYPDPATDASKTQDRHYLEHQFNLLGYKLDDSAAILGQPSALLPVGAADVVEGEEVAHMAAVPTDDSSIWQYRVTIPVARYARNPVPSLHEANLPAVANPYAGVGGAAAVRLNWQDFFGNTIRTPLSDMAVEADIRYTDPLIGVSRWPGVSVEYAFPPATGSGGQIQLTFAFDPSQYWDAEGRARSDYAQVDAATYRRLYYQLLPPEVEVSFTTTLNGSGGNPGAPVTVDKTQLVNYVASLYLYLHRIASGSAAGQPPVSLTITKPVTLSNPDHIFELVVALTIQRKEHVAEEFARADGVGAITSTIMPLTSESSLPGQNGAERGSISLSEFADQFEAMFGTASGLMPKIAVGTTKDDLGSTQNDKKVWVVRFDSQGRNGIDVRVESGSDGPKQAFFAPIPLANSPETYTDVAIGTYESGKTYPVDQQNKTFANVNLDVWGRQFLDAVDEFLSPEYAVPAFLVDNGTTLQSILNAKETLAEAIVGTVDRILLDDDDLTADTSSAQEKLKQRLLIRLANAYGVDAVVQHPVSVVSRFDGSNQEPAESAPYVPRLFGKLVCSGDTAQNDVYSLSTAKIPLGKGRSWLTYLFDARTTEHQSSYLFNDLAYQITHIEHQIEEVPKMGGYRASAWLSFVRPLRVPVPVGRVNVPIPLRAYPASPSLVAQTAGYRQNGGPDQVTTITEARQWDYEFTYEKAEASQDTIHAEIQLNIRPDQALAFGDGDQITLPEALAQFVSVYPLIRDDFTSALVKISVATDKTSPEFKRAQYAVEAFSTVVNAVARAWTHWNQVNPRGGAAAMTFAASAAPATVIYHYEIIEAPETSGDAGTPLVITVNRASDEPDSPLPAVRLAGYALESAGHRYRYYREDSTGARTYLAFKDRASVPDRRVALQNLDILNTQNAWSGVLVKRNEALVQNRDGSHRTTNPRFIYQTPLVRFYNKLLPLLVCDETIDLAAGPDGLHTLPLAEHLGNMLADLLKNQGQNTQTVKLECSYRYTLGNAGPVTLPVLLVPPLELDPRWDSDVSQGCADENTSFACQISRKLRAWFDTHQPDRTGGALIFRAEVYGYYDTRLPLLKLNTLILALAHIKEFASAR